MKEFWNSSTSRYAFFRFEYWATSLSKTLSPSFNSSTRKVIVFSSLVMVLLAYRLSVRSFLHRSSLLLFDPLSKMVPPLGLLTIYFNPCSIWEVRKGICLVVLILCSCPPERLCFRSLKGSIARLAVARGPLLSFNLSAMSSSIYLLYHQPLFYQLLALQDTTPPRSINNNYIQTYHFLVGSFVSPSFFWFS